MPDPQGFPFGGADIFEQFFRADPRLQSLLNRVQMPPLRITFMVRTSTVGTCVRCFQGYGGPVRHTRHACGCVAA